MFWPTVHADNIIQTSDAEDRNKRMKQVGHDPSHRCTQRIMGLSRDCDERCWDATDVGNWDSLETDITEMM